MNKQEKHNKKIVQNLEKISTNKLNDFINKNKPTKNTIITRAINILMPTPTLSSSTKSFSSDADAVTI